MNGFTNIDRETFSVQDIQLLQAQADVMYIQQVPITKDEVVTYEGVAVTNNGEVIYHKET